MAKADGYLCSYFKDNTSGTFLAWSEDGYTWRVINGGQPVLVPKNSHMRDPCILQGPDGTFHLTYGPQQGPGSKHFAYTSSPNLIDWEEPKFIPVERGILASGVRNTWAPELYYHAAEKRFLIIWSSATKEISTLPSFLKGDQKCYFMATTDFEIFTEPQLVLNPHPPVYTIDLDLFEANDQWYAFYKIESDNEVDGEKTGIHYSTAPALEGPWSAPVPEPHESLANATGNNEGPCPIQIDEYTVLYYDHGAMRSQDMVQWEDCSDLVTWPPGFTHAAFIPIEKRWVKPLH